MPSKERREREGMEPRGKEWEGKERKQRCVVQDVASTSLLTLSLSEREARERLLILYPEARTVREGLRKKRYQIRWYELILCEWVKTEGDAWRLCAERHCR